MKPSLCTFEGIDCVLVNAKVAPLPKRENATGCLLILPSETDKQKIYLAGVAVGSKNWLRITFAIEPSSLEEGLARLKAFCQRHAKKQ